MTKGFAAVEEQCRKAVQDIRNGSFAPIYLLMGDEPYYPDMLCEEIIRHALTDSERDFNQSVYYGLDTDAGTVASDARSYPMMAERRLVVLKEAQNMKTLEDLGAYAAEPLESTVLVILMHGASADKRRSLYKNVQKNGFVLDSPQVRDYEMPEWISAYYRTRGIAIDPQAAALLGEYAGTDLGKIAVETDKMLKSLPEGVSRVTAEDIEKNVGISRQYSIFELTKELSLKNSRKALKIAAHIASGPRFVMAMAVPPIFNHFYRILRLHSVLRYNPALPRAEKARILGVNPYFVEEYDTAVRNYPLTKCMSIIALLEEYDYKGKGGASGEAGQDELLVELVARILA